MKPFILCFCVAAASGEDSPGQLLREEAVTEPAGHQILEGWIEAVEGPAWLSVELVDSDGRIAGRHATPPVPAGAGWTYTAVETDPAGQRSVARILLHASGKASARDVRLAPFSPRLIANGGMEAPLDRRGRVPLWSEEKDDGLLAVDAGRRAGSHALDASQAHGGAVSLLVSATGDAHAVSSINYPIPRWSDRFEITAWARVEGGTRARVHAAWAGDGGSPILRADAGPPPAGPEARWQRLSTGPIEPPQGATVLRAVLSVAREPTAVGAPASARFDDVEIVTLPPRKPSVIVTVNQVGYEAEGPKSAVVLTNFFPRSACLGTLEVFAGGGQAAGEPRLRLPLACAGRIRGEKQADWGWYCWRADFSTLGGEGTYHIRATIGEASGESFPFRVGNDILFRDTAPSIVDFFFVQRCGFEVPGWHAACHLDDAKLPDGSHRDLTGGWHSAGDYNKITWEYGDGGAVYALARAASAGKAILDAGDRDSDGLADAIDEAWWGAKYLAKLQSLETGAFLKDIQQGPDRQSWMRWVPPEKQSDGVPGTADDPIVLEGEGHSPLAIGGWARTAKLLEGRGAKHDFIERARKSWERETAAPGARSSPLLLASTLELHSVTGEERLKAFALEAAREILFPGASGAEQKPGGEQLRGGYGDSGDIPAAALALCALQFPGEQISGTIRERLAEHLDRIVAEARNPFGVTKQKADREGEEGYFFEPTSVYGQSFLFGCRAWSALLIHRLLGDRRALEYAVDQLDFLLGKNPYNLCLLEGKGSLNPPRYHHRYDSIPGRKRGAVPGAIPNGFVRDSGSHDRPGFDLSTGGRDHPSYRTSEPWLVHNVFFLLAVTALHEGLARVAAPPESFFALVRERDRDEARKFYKKHLDVGGIPVVAAAEVADQALERTRSIVLSMLAGRPDILRAMVQNGMYLIIIGKDQVYTDMPEYRHHPSPAYQNERVRGTGGKPTSFGEENLLSLPFDRYDDESIAVHEFCHTIDGALRSIDPGWSERRRGVYDRAIGKGLWKHTYAGSNPGEFWAEICQSYFDCNRVNNWNHGPIGTREQLQAYDPESYELVRTTFNLRPEQDWRYTWAQKLPNVSAPPERLRIDPYYTKLTLAREFLVLGRKASDEALLAANDTVRKMFAYRHDILKALIADGVKLVVLGQDEKLGDLPEHKVLKDLAGYDPMVRTLDFTPEAKIVAVGEENVLGNPADPRVGEHALIRLMARALYRVTGTRPVDPNWEKRGRDVQQYELRVQRLDVRFDEKLKRAYDSAMGKGLWKGTAAVQDRADYWASGVVAYFDAAGGVLAPAGSARAITTREALKEYDPDLFALAGETMAYDGHVDWRYGQRLEPIPDRLVVLTFDDSVKSHFTVVRPALLRRGFGATFFVTEGFDFPTNKTDYMTWEEIAQLHKDGFEIGNHTQSHLGVQASTVDRLRGEVQAIAERCQAHGIPAPTSFAYPGNAITPEALPILRELGIRFARRGGAPERPYEGGEGVPYEPGEDHPLLIPSGGDARPAWTLADLVRAVEPARGGKIAVLQLHGVPDRAHPWVHTPPERFEEYLDYLAKNGYRVVALRDLARYVDWRAEPKDPLQVIERRRGK